MNLWSIVVAAGKGSRFGSPKQLHPLAGRRVVDWAVNAVSAVGPVVLVGPAQQDSEKFFASSTATSALAVDRFVEGGTTRSDSVRAGLSSLPLDVSHVLIHDAARPLVAKATIDRVVTALANGAEGVVPVVPVIDTLRTRDGKPFDRSTVVAIQTPQGFDVEALRSAYRSGVSATDDSALLAAAGGTIVHVDGDPLNSKITYPADITVAEALLASKEGCR